MSINFDFTVDKMSVVSKESFQLMEKSISLSNLSLDVLSYLANDIEYCVSEIMQVYFLITNLLHFSCLVKRFNEFDVCCDGQISFYECTIRCTTNV